MSRVKFLKRVPQIYAKAANRNVKDVREKGGGSRVKTPYLGVSFTGKRNGMKEKRVTKKLKNQNLRQTFLWRLEPYLHKRVGKKKGGGQKNIRFSTFWRERKKDVRLLTENYQTDKKRNLSWDKRKDKNKKGEEKERLG